MKKVIEGILCHSGTEDSRHAKIAELDDGEAEGLFVRVQSWSKAKRHEEYDQFIGKKVPHHHRDD